MRHRVEAINQAFRNSIAEFNYQGKYRGVFPIKVNQLREVVEEILDAGKPFDFGLEVGSKPELFAGLALQNQMGSLIICNGYKDAEFIKMALLGIKLGKKVIMVVEKLEELRQIIAISKQLGVEPLIGIRARLLSKGAGNWAESGGENAKFGLSTAELLDGDGNVEGGKSRPLLQAAAFPHRLAGAGHSDGEKSGAGGRAVLRQAAQDGFRHRIPRCRRRAGRGLRRQPLGVRQLDQLHACRNTPTTSFITSPTSATPEKVPHPNIISESGRAIVAHHSVLIVEVFGAIEKIRPGEFLKYGDNEHALVRELLDIKKNLAKLNKLEAFHDALERREDAQHMFTLGLLDLPDKAKIENLYWEISRDVVESFKGQAYVPEEIRKLEDSLGDQYLCNFSVFQSLLDHWALGPVVSHHADRRLNERPTREATLVDITCDSDGAGQQVH